MKFEDLNLLSVGHTIQMAGAIWAGEGKIFICPLPGEDLSQVTGEGVETLVMGPDEWEQFNRQTDLLETEVLAQLEDGKLGKILLRKGSRQISQNVSWQVYRRDGYACRYCGADQVPLTVDHLVLWEDGGPSIPANLVAACKKCNKTRGNTKYEDWLKHRYYLKVSKQLDPAVRQANEDLLLTLAGIPIMVHKPKSR
jgi:hypothetical protein